MTKLSNEEMIRKMVAEAVDAAFNARIHHNPGPVIDRPWYDDLRTTIESDGEGLDHRPLVSDFDPVTGRPLGTMRVQPKEFTEEEQENAKRASIERQTNWSHMLDQLDALNHNHE